MYSNKSNDSLAHITSTIFIFAAGMIALSGSICEVGYRFVIRQKFSSDNFWKDCIKHNATVALYIGEVNCNKCLY